MARLHRGNADLRSPHENLRHLFVDLPGKRPRVGAHAADRPLGASSKHWVAPDGADEDQSSQRTYPAQLDGIGQMQEEDTEVCRGVEAGLDSRFPWLGRYAELDAPLRQFHASLSDQCDGGAADLGKSDEAPIRPCRLTGGA
jgi:hypothetical protein